MTGNKIFNKIILLLSDFIAVICFSNILVRVLMWVKLINFLTVLQTKLKQFLTPKLQIIL